MAQQRPQRPLHCLIHRIVVVRHDRLLSQESRRRTEIDEPPRCGGRGPFDHRLEHDFAGDFARHLVHAEEAGERLVEATRAEPLAVFAGAAVLAQRHAAIDTAGFAFLATAGDFLPIRAAFALETFEGFQGLHFGAWKPA
jgi:hypothetical protein